VTPSGKRKGFLKPQDMVVCDLGGAPIKGEKNKPSSEMAMHVAVYEERPDVSSVVHAHPPCTIAHTVAGISLAAPLMPEAYCELGEIVTLPYTTPTTLQVPDALRAPIRNHCAVVMERHGSITVGPSLDVAYDRLEILEHVAKISMMSRALSPSGTVDGLSEEKLQQLRMFLGCGLGC
jgi:L-fuculose-phosphate aldolase